MSGTVDLFAIARRTKQGVDVLRKNDVPLLFASIKETYRAMNRLGVSEVAEAVRVRVTIEEIGEVGS